MFGFQSRQEAEQFVVDAGIGEPRVLRVGDRVALSSDPAPELRQGTVVHEEQNNSRFFVHWDVGRTWIYAKNDLVRV